MLVNALIHCISPQFDHHVMIVSYGNFLYSYYSFKTIRLAKYINLRFKGGQMCRIRT